jgi:hypothetical protein
MFKILNEKINQIVTVLTDEEPKHYDNSKGSLYQFCDNHDSYEFDIIKRVMRKKRQP